MQKSEGVGLLIVPGMPARERKTFKCNHCDGIRLMTVTRPDGIEDSNVFWCDVCDARVCGSCLNEARDHRCVVWEQKMEIMESKGRFIRDVKELLR